MDILNRTQVSIKGAVSKVLYDVILSEVEEFIDMENRCFDFAQHDNQIGDVTY